MRRPRLPVCRITLTRDPPSANLPLCRRIALIEPPRPPLPPRWRGWWLSVCACVMSSISTSPRLALSTIARIEKLHICHRWREVVSPSTRLASAPASDLLSDGAVRAHRRTPRATQHQHLASLRRTAQRGTATSRPAHAPSAESCERQCESEARNARAYSDRCPRVILLSRLEEARAAAPRGCAGRGMDAP